MQIDEKGLEARDADYKKAWDAGRLSDLGWEMANQNAAPLSLLSDYIASCKAMVDAILGAPLALSLGARITLADGTEAWIAPWSEAEGYYQSWLADWTRKLNENAKASDANTEDPTDVR